MREGKQQHAVCSNVWSVFNLNNPKIYAMERNQSSALVRLSSCSLRLSFAFGVVGVFASVGSAASTSKDTYYVNDHLATTVATSDASGEIAQIEADAFGTQTGPVAKDARFTGKPYDADMGAYVFPFRNYRSDEARWMSADPSGFPNGNNACKYAPIANNELDPLGLELGPETRAQSSVGPYIWLDAGTTTETHNGFCVLEQYPIFLDTYQIQNEFATRFDWTEERSWGYSLVSPVTGVLLGGAAAYFSGGLALIAGETAGAAVGQAFQVVLTNTGWSIVGTRSQTTLTPIIDGRTLYVSSVITGYGHCE